MVDWNQFYVILLWHQGRVHVEFALIVNLKQQLVVLSLFKLGPIDVRIVIHSDVKFATFSVQKSCNVPHDQRDVIRIRNVLEMLELDRPALDQGYFLPVLEIVVRNPQHIAFHLL